MAEEKGRKIPVFTVLKNGAILKNIFVIEKPRVMEDEEDPHNQESETEEILIVGRHPDCNIMLTHPSISRFHLQIHSRPSSQKLSVLDLSSVHGTWVSGKKIDPLVAVELKEGDTLKLGGSTRVYKLHWIPMSRAYDMENPFVSSLDTGVEEEKEKESAVESHLGVNTLSTERECGEDKDSLMVEEEEEEEETSQSSVATAEKEVFSMDWLLDGIASLFGDGSSGESGLVMNTEIPPAPPMPENMNCSTYETENSLEERELLILKDLETYSATVTVEEKQQKMDVSRVSTQSHLMEPNLQGEDMVLNILDSQQVHEEDRIPQPISALKPRKERENAATDGCKHYLSGKIEDADDEKLSSKDYERQHTGLNILDSQQVHEEQIPHPLSALKQREESENAAADGCTHYFSGKIEDADDEKLSSKDCGSQHTGLNKLESQQVPEEDQIPHPLSALKPREESENAAADGCKQYLSGKIEDADDEKLSSKDFGSQHTGLNILDSQQVHEEDQIPYPLSALKPREESENAAADGCKHYLSGKMEDAEGEILSSKDYGSQHADFNILKSQQVHEEDQIPQPLSALKPREESENAAADGCKHYLSGKMEDAEGEILSSKDYGSQHTDLNILESQQVHEEDQIPQPLSALEPREESENKENAAADGCTHYFSGKIEDADDAKLSSKDYGSQQTSSYSVSLPTESVNSSLPITEDDKRNLTPHSLLAPAVPSESENLDGSPLRLEPKSNFQSIWSRRGKPDCVLQIQTGKSGADENKPVPKSLFVSSEDEEMFTPDKENFTPNTILMKALKRKGKLEETKHSSSKVTFSSHLQRENNMITSDKENHSPKLIKEHKYTRKASRNQPKLEQEMVIKGKAARVPFQTVSEASVPNNSVRSCKSTTLNTKKMEKRIGYPSLNKSVGEQRRTWTMVADTSSLMDKESRKMLKLLQGLKGTLLIIPRIVIRELDCLKRHGTLFGRKNEASSVLEWIEECMVKTKWWIHVQSTMEEGWPIAPTPPATPYSHFSQGSMFGPFSARESLMEIATPTAQDHILDYALLCRKMSIGDEKLVLLSNDVTLKIKAMAEGLICEKVQEFRESLVNPFSERFMWADSSPRGHTWSVMDDVVLRDKYTRCPLKKPSKGDVKGLKLILLHNSHYGQISSIR